MTKLNGRREGFALAAAVLAMLVVGALVTGGFYAASQEGQVSKSSEAADLAMYISETGLSAALGNTPSATLDAMPYNSSMPVATQNVQFGGATVGTYSGEITRLTESLFVVRITGTVTIAGPYAGATRMLATVTRLRKAQFDNNTAIQVFGDLTVTGTSDIDATDYVNLAWSGCTANATASAVLTNPGSNITTQGAGQIHGDVAREELDAADFTVFGDYTFDDIAAMANIRYTTTATVHPAPSLTGHTPPRCNIVDMQNWGDPTNATSPCYSHFPIVLAESNLNINATGSGQGVLLVRGNLDLSGGFTFYGVVVVMGSVRSTGTGGHVHGTLITFGNGDLDSSTLAAGSSLVQYSSCAIERTVLGNPSLSRSTPIPNRSWLDLSIIQNAF